MMSSRRPPRRRRAQRRRPGGAARDEVHRLEQRERRAGAEPFHPGPARRARGVHRDARLDVQRRARQAVDDADARQAAVVNDRLRGLDVIGQHRPVAGGRLGEGQRQPVRLGHVVVRPRRDAGHLGAGVAAERRLIGVAPEHAAGGQAQVRLDAGVPVEAERGVEEEPGSHRQRRSRELPRGPHHEGQRRDQGRRDPGHRPPLADREPGLHEVAGLQRPQPAVDGLRVVEGTAAPEVGALDERRREPALRGVVGHGEAVDAAPDHEHVESPRRQAGHSCESW